MYLVKRWDNVILDRSLEAQRAKELARDASVKGQRVDVIDYSDTRPEETVAMFMNGHEV
jgi:hypothetical protein